MSTLDDLFDDDRRAGDRQRVPMSSATARGLDAVVGERRQTQQVTRGNADTSRLIALVDGADVDSSATSVHPLQDKKRSKRGPRRVDWISISAASLALIVVVGTAGFAGVTAASASPTTLAAQTLAEDEEALASAEHGLTAAIDRLTSDIAAGVGQASSTRAAIVALDETVVDTTARDGVVAAIDQYVAALNALVVPEAGDAYEAQEFDASSLSAVAAATDDVRARSQAVDETVASVRTLRISADSSKTAYIQALSVFGGTFAAQAQRAADDNDAASTESRDFVVSSAAALAGINLNDSSGHQALAAYQAAVLALRLEDEAVRIGSETDERTPSRNNSQNNNQSGSQGETPPTDGGTGTQPTDPGTETPPSPEIPPEGGTDPAQP